MPSLITVVSRSPGRVRAVLLATAIVACFPGTAAAGDPADAANIHPVHGTGLIQTSGTALGTAYTATLRTSFSPTHIQPGQGFTFTSVMRVEDPIPLEDCGSGTGEGDFGFYRVPPGTNPWTAPEPVSGEALSGQLTSDCRKGGKYYDITLVVPGANTASLPVGCYQGTNVNADNWFPGDNGAGGISTLVVGGGECGVTKCADGLDNDEDTTTDFGQDPGCVSFADDDELGTLRCDNGDDDDGDALVDYPDDPGCSAPDDDDESLNVGLCKDGIDNDGDTYADYPKDPGCASPDDVDELGTAVCDNGSDDDGDGHTDWPKDPECISIIGEDEACVTVRCIAEKFRPSIFLDSTEHWAPQDTTRYLLAERPWVCKGTTEDDPYFDDFTTSDCFRVQPAFAAGVFTPAQTRAWSMYVRDPKKHDPRDEKYYDIAHYKSSVAGCVAGVRWDCDGDANSAIYYHHAARAGYHYLDYWFFYRMNHAPHGWAFFDEHQHDWEGMTVLVRCTGTGADPCVQEKVTPEAFDAVGYSSHFAVWWHLPGTVQGLAGPPIRPRAYVASGTHATYPYTCAGSCTQWNGRPATTGYLDTNGGALALPEARHDGARPWARNGTTQALLEFGPWNAFAGNWNTDAPIFGPSDGVSGFNELLSPSKQQRYQTPWDPPCKAAGSFAPEHWFDCLGAAKALISRQAPGGIDDCYPWFGPGVAVAVCDRRTLGPAIAARTLGNPGPVTLSAPGRAADNAPGLAQLAGKTLRAGQRVNITGPPGGGGVLTARVRLRRSRSDALVQFRQPQATSGATQLRVGRRVTIRTASGKTLRPTSIATERRPRPPRRVRVRRRGGKRILTFRATTYRTRVTLHRKRRLLQAKDIATRPRSRVRVTLPRRPRRLTVKLQSAAGRLVSRNVTRRLR